MQLTPKPFFFGCNDTAYRDSVSGPGFELTAVKTWNPNTRGHQGIPNMLIAWISKIQWPRLHMLPMQGAQILFLVRK